MNSHNLTMLVLAAAAAKSPQWCPTLCDPIDGSPPGSPFPGILQARTLQWVAISFSNAWKWKVQVKTLSRVRLLVTPWTAAYQAPPSMGLSRQERSSKTANCEFKLSEQLGNCGYQMFCSCPDVVQLVRGKSQEILWQSAFVTCKTH